MAITTQPEINVQDIKRRSFAGIIALTSRTFILQIIALIATFILTVLLDPTSFGVFFIVTAVVNFLNYFSDIGLAAALIQKKEEPTIEDLRTTFTIQQVLVGLAVIVAFLFSPLISRLYTIGDNGLFLYKALIVSFFLSSLKTIPSVILERKLDFKRLVVPQIIETVLFYLIAIVGAIKGLGVASFAWAALARGISGTVVLYMVAPWKIGLTINKESARRLLSFGIPYQANSFLALIKDDLITLFLGRILPLAAIGYIGWAKKWAEVALRLIMDNIIKVTFPTYARLQHDKELLTKAIHKSIQLLSLLTLPIATGMMLLIEPFIEVIPRYGKWEPALMSFYLFTLSSMLAALSSPLFNVLNALGKVKQTFLLMLFWTIVTWTLVPISVGYFGFNGVALSAVLIGLTSFLPLLFIRRIVRINILSLIAKPLFATICMVAVMGILRIVLPISIVQLLLGIFFGSLVYVTVIYFLMGDELRPYLDLLRHKTPHLD